MAQVLIFANPISGRGKGKATAAVLETHLRRNGYDVSTFLSRADSLRFDGPLDGVEAAIVIGGDGTLRGVAQWAIDSAAKLAGFEAGAPGGPCLPYPILVVPMGTANLMGRHLGIAWGEARFADEVLQTLRRRRVVHLDVANTRNGIFLLMAGIGFDAWVVHELGRVRAGPIDLTTYVLPTLKAIADYPFPRLEVIVDGKRVFSRAPALALVGNIKEYGTGFPMLPQARPDDQLLDVCVMPCSSRGQLLKLALAAAAGEHVREEGVVYVKGRHVRIESPDTAHVQVDGEPAGMAPVEIDLLPGRIPFMVPVESRQ